jgi:hypothetical protein
MLAGDASQVTSKAALGSRQQLSTSSQLAARAAGLLVRVYWFCYLAPAPHPASSKTKI